MADFIAYLDAKVGKGNYLLFLTADHGAAHNAQYLRDMKVPAGNVSEVNTFRQLAAHVKEEFKQDSLLRAIENYQVVLNDARIKAKGINRKQLRTVIREWLYQQPQVAFVVDMEDLNGSPVPEPIKTMAVNGYNRKRSGSMLIVLDPAWYYGYATTGTTHSASV